VRFGEFPEIFRVVVTDTTRTCAQSDASREHKEKQ